jgi:guanosine-3',5'-bis(diphosphate) 3'-pyrophosphohydrolase
MEDLLSRIKHPVSSDDRARIERAYLFATEKHAGQVRNSGEPYVEHSLAVAKNCADLSMDIDTIIGALLHDTLEDTDTTEDEIRELFGESILFLVKGVTKLGKLKYQGADRHVESLRKFFVAIAEDLRVLIIKLADRLHNVATLEHVRPDKRRRIALETIEVHASLAGRLGMEYLKGILEDYAFPYAYPDEHARTSAIMAEIVPESQTAITYAHGQIEQTLRDFDIQSAVVSSRIKHTYSTYRKLTKYNWNTELVYDIVALRILVPTIPDCYQVLGLIHMLWKPIRSVSKTTSHFRNPTDTSPYTRPLSPSMVSLSFRSAPMKCTKKPSSVLRHTLHTKSHNLRRTPSSKTKSLPGSMNSKSYTVSSTTHHDFSKSLRIDFFTRIASLSLPHKGDVIDLPEGASPIDFAYAVHSAIGDRTHGPPKHQRQNGIGLACTHFHNGDVVEIQTSKHATPTGTKWLDYRQDQLCPQEDPPLYRRAWRIPRKVFDQEGVV